MTVWIVVGVGLVAWTGILWWITKPTKGKVKMPYHDSVSQQWLDEQHSQPPSARRRE